MTATITDSKNFRDCFWGPNGFEELKKYMRLGNDFCRELASILTERAENEITYSKSLNKTSLRMQKLAKDFHGGLSDAWLQVSLQFDAEAEMHKSLSTALQEEIIKPLKILADNQIKFRKPVELKVEKAIKNLSDKKADDYKYRSRCFQLVKDIEKSMYNLDEAQKGLGGKPPNQKEIQKIQSQIDKNKEYLDKSELKYHKACGAVELARQDWQIEILRGCDQLESIECDRISSLDQLIKKLAIQFNVLKNKMTKVVEIVQGLQVNVENDIVKACEKYGTCKNEQELYLFDIYAENTKNMMNRDRRLANLTRWSDLFTADIESQVKSRQGLDKVKTFAKQNPSFNSNNDGEVNQKLESVKLLQILYEASLFKVQTALAELLDNSKPTYENSSNMTTIYDKQGVPLTTLKLNPSQVDTNNFFSKPSAPSPPASPTRISIGSAGSIPTPANRTSAFSSIQGSSSNTQLSQLNNNYAPVPMQMPQPIHYNLYDSSALNSGSGSTSSYSYVGGESSSSSSISTSSVSPAALSSSSSTQHSQSSPLPLVSNNKSSYLLTTATNNINNSSDHPPSYSMATTLKRNSNSSKTNAPTINTSTTITNNNNSIKTNHALIENHYNNSTQSSDDDDDDWSAPQYRYVGKCVAQYDFKATRDDELTINTGDLINIMEKRNDGWWKGHLRSSVGLFPSSYVKES